ncbi:MAG: efflux RND transporter periplasmic adaptor subunit [Anaerolineae bacterium]|jgi:HlyD family secretion protein
MKRKTLYVTLGIVAIAAVAGALYWQWQQRSSQPIEDLRSTVVEQGNLLVAVSASGNVGPQKRVDLAFEARGQVVEVAVEVDDSVEAGDLLARLASERLSLQVDQAKANLASAEAQLARLEAGPGSEEVRAAEANLRATEAQLNAARAERDQVKAGASRAQIAAIEAEVASALTQRKKADDFHEQTMKCITIKKEAGEVIPLPGGQVITLTESFEETICPLLGVPEEQARYGLEAADEALRAARARLEELKEGTDQDQLRVAQSNVATAAANRDAAQAQLDLLLDGPTREQVAAAEAAVTQARASLKEAELTLKQATLVAPFEGIVAAVDVTVGEQASAGLPVLTLVDPSRFHVTLAVDEIDVGQVSEGHSARLTFDALPDATVTGIVDYVASAAELNGGVVTYDVRIDLAATEAPIRTGMTANASIVVQELSDVLRIPTWVVRVDSDTGQTYVHRRVGDQLARVDIRVGARSEGVAQALEGLSKGDVLVRLPESSPFGFGGN